MRIEIGKSVFQANDKIAGIIREKFLAGNVTALNIISSPGSGKTSLLEKSLPLLAERWKIAVIEGDISTERDAERIRQMGFSAVQIETMGGCHLDAPMVIKALQDVPFPENGFLFIENVGNLVCPSSYDLGETAKVVLLSVAEGDDKPLKYPAIFAGAKVVVLNKLDLLPYTDFNVDKFRQEALSINPALEIIGLSCRTGEGLEDWIKWLENLKK